MLRVTLWHEPEGFQFYVSDPGDRELRSSTKKSVEMRDSGFSAERFRIAIRTISEFSRIPIVVEYAVDGFTDEIGSEWDHVVECVLETKNRKLVFEGSTDLEPFGVLEVPNGIYRVRIHFGGQMSGQVDGSSADFYLIQIWPDDASTDVSTRILKGELLWPRPAQPWERGEAP
jgi:hypothetical protein